MRRRWQPASAAALLRWARPAAKPPRALWGLLGALPLVCYGGSAAEALEGATPGALRAAACFALVRGWIDVHSEGAGVWVCVWIHQGGEQ